MERRAFAAAGGLALSLALLSHIGMAKPRARDLGIPFTGTPGPLNAITDLPGVEVGQVTLIEGEGKLKIGKGPIRTGVTAILPRGKKDTGPKFPTFASWFSLNGNGEMTGTTWLDDSGVLEGPIVLTNTYSVGTAHEAVVKWRVRQGQPENAIGLPVVAETWDGFLNDINGFHVKDHHVWQALDGASGGKVAEGSVGGGTGMICYELKCGTGTASRVVETKYGKFLIGVLVQANYGLRRQLRVAGIPLGQHFPGNLVWDRETGSIIIVVGTDAPLLPHQLKRLAKRPSHGMGRLGAISGDGSGDIFITFSTANKLSYPRKKIDKVEFLPNETLDEFFQATADAVEESILNSMVAADTMKGIDNHIAMAVPIPKLLERLKEHKRLNK